MLFDIYYLSYYFEQILQSVLLVLLAFVLKFVNVQHNSKSTAGINVKFSGSISSVTRKNLLKFGHNRVNNLNCGAIC